MNVQLDRLNLPFTATIETEVNGQKYFLCQLTKFTLLKLSAYSFSNLEMESFEQERSINPTVKIPANLYQQC